MALLEIKNLGISFGGLRAVDDFSITIEKGQLYGLIGPNGAGKTTIFNLLTGVYKPNMGTIQLDGMNITGKKSRRLCHVTVTAGGVFVVSSPERSMTSVLMQNRQKNISHAAGAKSQSGSFLI